MRGTLYSKVLKKLVEQWRVKGKSYGEITRRFNVPKSTLSTWLNKRYAYIYKERQFEHLARSRPLALAAIRRRIEKVNEGIKEKVAVEFKNYPLADVGFQKTMLAMLYWAEGSKSEKSAGLIQTLIFIVSLLRGSDNASILMKRDFVSTFMCTTITT